MACECIENAKAIFRKDTGDPEANVKVVFSLDNNSIKNFIPIQASYRLKKKDGTFGRVINMNIMGAYCPFCGKQL